MSRHRDADLGRWEAGELTDDELRRRHPGDDLGTIIAVHRHLSELLDTPTPDPSAAWAALAPALSVRDNSAVRPRRYRSRRAVVAAVITSVLAVPTVAYAAAPDAVRSIAREVRDLLPGTNNDGDHNDIDDADPSTTTVTSTPPAPTTTQGSRADESEQVDENDHEPSGSDTQGPDTQGPDNDIDTGTDVDVDGTADSGTSNHDEGSNLSEPEGDVNDGASGTMGEGD